MESTKDRRMARTIRLARKSEECDPAATKRSLGMDRRTAIATGLAAAFAKPAWADTVVPGDGVIPSDPKENILLWPDIPPGGEGLKLPPIRVSNHEPPYITPR